MSPEVYRWEEWLHRNTVEVKPKAPPVPPLEDEPDGRPLG